MPKEENEEEEEEEEEEEDNTGKEAKGSAMMELTFIT
jgi:hypothetical protein